MNANRALLGSPRFVKRNTATIAANGKLVLDFMREDESSKKYGPFNQMTVTNDSSSNIFVWKNQDSNDKVLVVAGTIKTLDKTSMPGLWSVTIEELEGASISANLITVEVQKEVVDTDKVISGVVGWLFGKAGV